MPKSITINPITGNFDVVTADGSIPQYDSDPSSPTPETAWVLKSGGATGGGSPIGLLLALTDAGSGGSPTYELSYRTLEDTTIRVELT